MTVEQPPRDAESNGPSTSDVVNAAVCLIAAALWFAAVRYIWAWDAYVGPIVGPAFLWLIPAGVDEASEMMIQRIAINAIPAFAVAIPAAFVIRSRHWLRWIAGLALFLSVLAAAPYLDVLPIFLEPTFIALVVSPAVGVAAGAALVNLLARRKKAGTASVTAEL